jgi:selenide,water dikinase
VLEGLPEIENPNVLVGTKYADDAGVYLLSKRLALVQTTDFFPPVVDDPYDYGAIAAANALSDVYAMGAKPLTALNLVGFPSQGEARQALPLVLKGGADKAREAGIEIIGGHTVKNPEPLYGLMVTGVVNPQKIIKNAGAKVGDRLILTKPIGTGIITTAIKKGLASAEITQRVVEVMKRLNKDAAEVMVKSRPSAATDVTGYGLLGHLNEMLCASQVSAVVWADEVPVIEGTRELAERDVYPGGTKDNYKFLETDVLYSPDISFEEMLILCDAQTSGGLLISVPQTKTRRLVKSLLEKGEVASVIGEVVEEQRWRIRVERKRPVEKRA